MKAFLLGIVGIVLLGIVGFVFSLDKTEQEPQQPSDNAQQQEQQKEAEQAVNELQIEDLAVGEGAEATPGSLVTAHYTGTLLDGSVFDSSLERGEPFQFTLGAGNVIRGWDQGIAGMKVGGKRKLVIPPHLAYGQAQGHPLQQETLVFQVELLDVQEQ